ncbi:hypothetical protein KDL29_02840 [bacterium]|nr:hypothetical protein [bacterium]
MSSRYPVAGTLPLLFLLLTFMPCACGGGHEAASGLAIQPEDRIAAVPHSIELNELQQQLDSLSIPAGVDPTVFDALRRELSTVLAARIEDRIASSAPLKEINRIRDLQLSVDAAPEVTLEWSYVNVGDYDQNGEANLADLTVIGLYFGRTESDPDWEHARLADGDGNGEVNIADVSPLGNNFLAQLTSYVVYGGYTESGPWDVLAQIPLQGGLADPALHFSHSLPADSYPAYMVLPLDSEVSPGIPAVLFGNSVPFGSLLDVDSASLQSGALADVQFSIALSPAGLSDMQMELLELDADGGLIQDLGPLLDDGQPASGDDEAGDLRFSSLQQLESADPVTRYFRVQLDYLAGELPRSVHSNTVEVQFSEGISPARVTELLGLAASLQAELEELAETMPIDQASDAAFQSLLASGKAVDPVLNEDGNGFIWLSPEGLPFAAGILSAEPAVTEESGTSAAGELRREASSAAFDQQPGNHNHSVISLEPFGPPADGQPALDDVRSIADLLQASTCPLFQLDEYQGNAATVERFKQIDDYGIVLVSSYGQRFYRKDGTRGHGVLTGELASADSIARYRVDLRLLGNNRRRMYIHASGYLMLTTDFFSEYCRRSSGGISYLAFEYSRQFHFVSYDFRLGGSSLGYVVGVSPRYTPSQDFGRQVISNMLKGQDVFNAIGQVITDSGINPYKQGLDEVGNSYWTISPSQYVICEVPTLGRRMTEPTGPAESHASDLNNLDQVVGYSSDPQGATVAIQWDARKCGAAIRLGTLGGQNSRAHAINDFGQVVGESDDAQSIKQPFQYQAQNMKQLATVGGRGSANDISNATQVVGWMEPGFAFTDSHPTDFTQGFGVSLGVLGVGSPSSGSPELGEALAVADSGVIVGFASDWDNGGVNSFITQGSSLLRMPYEYIHLGTPTESFYRSARTIDPSGNVVVGGNFLMEIKPGPGQTVSVQGYGSRWRQGNLRPLFPEDGNGGWIAPDGFDPTLRSYEVEANGVALDGTVVGSVVTLNGTEASAFRAFIIQQGLQPRWLDELIPCDSGWILYSANAINGFGAIAGDGRYQGEARGFFLRPSTLQQ